MAVPVAAISAAVRTPAYYPAANPYSSAGQEAVGHLAVPPMATQIPPAPAAGSFGMASNGFAASPSVSVYAAPFVPQSPGGGFGAIGSARSPVTIRDPRDTTPLAAAAEAAAAAAAAAGAAAAAAPPRRYTAQR
jgi:hypothetical protein